MWVNAVSVGHCLDVANRKSWGVPPSVFKQCSCGIAMHPMTDGCVFVPSWGDRETGASECISEIWMGNIVLLCRTGAYLNIEKLVIHCDGQFGA